ncbi:MAG: ATP-binding protein [Hyphomonadaceae bacterium]
MTAALIVASAINLAVLVSERFRAGQIENSTPYFTRFADIVADLNEDPHREVRRFGALGRPGSRVTVDNINAVDALKLHRNNRLERRLQKAFSLLDVTPPDVRVASRILGEAESAESNEFFRRTPGAPPSFDQRELRRTRTFRDQANEPPRPPNNTSPPPSEWRRAREFVMSAQLADGAWLNGRFLVPRAPSGDYFRLAGGTLVTLLFVLAAAVWTANRISRPLKNLAQASATVGSKSTPQELPVEGPEDVRRTLAAFNAMNSRVSQLLGEKDLMLGALGHDLRTPLTSLRIRLETMEPEAERLKAIRTIEETTQQLETMLDLARHGRNSEPMQLIDLAVLVEDICEDYQDTGAQVSFTKGQRVPVSCRPLQMKRMLRNLVDNALTYAGSATVSVGREAGIALNPVEDEGPGMSADALETAKEPFRRIETSRNRQTGGAGLGLAIADMIARGHDGELRLENRTPKGLAAIVRLPLAQPRAPKNAAP